jgi:hypothetical protein
MNKMKSHTRALIIAVVIIVAIVLVLLIGPIFINWIFVTETVDWNIHWAFSAGEILQYYGAILGGLVMGLTIIVSIHINNRNLKRERKRAQFERAYELYHRLPEILAKLEVTAIHVQYSATLNENQLMETLDAMKESESILREQHFVNDAYYNKTVDALIKKIIACSVKCQDSVEQFLKDKERVKQLPQDNEIMKQRETSGKIMDDAFVELREVITTAKSEIMNEINKFIFSDDAEK